MLGRWVFAQFGFLNFKGGKFSKSRGGAVEVPYFLTKYDPDALRFYLTRWRLKRVTPKPALRDPKGSPGKTLWSGTTLS